MFLGGFFYLFFSDIIRSIPTESEVNLKWKMNIKNCFYIKKGGQSIGQHIVHIVRILVRNG